MRTKSFRVAATGAVALLLSGALAFGQESLPAGTGYRLFGIVAASGFQRGLPEHKGQGCGWSP